MKTCALPECDTVLDGPSDKLYCGTAHRKKAFKLNHADTKPVRRDVMVRSAFDHDGNTVKPSKCGHFVAPGSRCLQKGCYGVVSKK